MRMMIDAFLDYLQFELNRSALTVLSYGDDLRAFEMHFKNKDTQLSWETVDADIIRDWMESMMDKGCNATSVNRRLSALRSFYRFALMRGWVEKSPMQKVVGPKRARPLPQFVREKEMNRLLDDIPCGESFKEVLAYTMILTFYTTGIRLAELVGLDNPDVDFVNQVMKVTGKRSKQRLIPFGEELANGLKRYIALRDKIAPRQSSALFVTEDGARVTRSLVQRKVQEGLSKVTTLKKKSPHVLRHTFATAMLNHEAGLESVKKLLGHESLSTTEIYTHTTFEQLKKVYNQAHPRA